MPGPAWQGNKRLNALIAPAFDANYTQMSLTFFISFVFAIKVFSLKAFHCLLQRQGLYETIKTKCCLFFRGVSKGQPF